MPGAPERTILAKQWSEFTYEEKREERCKRWLSPAGVNFNSPEARKKIPVQSHAFDEGHQDGNPRSAPVTIPSGTYVPAGRY
jgi:hypothetical protein